MFRQGFVCPDIGQKENERTHCSRNGNCSPFPSAGNPDVEVICDVTRQLGTFLIDFEQDPDGEWNRLGLAPLREALHTNRWKQPDLEKTAGSFLRQKYQTGGPVRQYAAFRI